MNVAGRFARSLNVVGRTVSVSRRPGANAVGAGRRMGGHGPPTTHVTTSDLKKVHQDMPPAGGYPDVVFKKGDRLGGPEYWKIWVGSILMVAFGFYRVGQTNIEANAAKKEKREARLAFVPYLQAEEDRRAVAAYKARDAREAEIMKGVKDWNVGESVYQQDKFWAPPTPVEHPRHNLGHPSTHGPN